MNNDIYKISKRVDKLLRKYQVFDLEEMFFVIVSLNKFMGELNLKSHKVKREVVYNLINSSYIIRKKDLFITRSDREIESLKPVDKLILEFEIYLITSHFPGRIIPVTQNGEREYLANLRDKLYYLIPLEDNLNLELKALTIIKTETEGRLPAIYLFKSQASLNKTFDYVNKTYPNFELNNNSLSFCSDNDNL